MHTPNLLQCKRRSLGGLMIFHPAYKKSLNVAEPEFFGLLWLKKLTACFTAVLFPVYSRINTA